MPEQKSLVTQTLLNEAKNGVQTIDLLFPIVYNQLRSIARRHLNSEQRRTLQTTALVHEVYLKLVGESQVTEKGKAYFLAASARAMRRILIDRARQRKAQKRGAGESHLTLEESQIATDTFAGNLLDLENALTELATHNNRQAQVVECRYFGGMTVAETADALQVSTRTVHNDWIFARAWLLSKLDDS